MSENKFKKTDFSITGPTDVDTIMSNIVSLYEKVIPYKNSDRVETDVKIVNSGKLVIGRKLMNYQYYEYRPLRTSQFFDVMKNVDLTKYVQYKKYEPRYGTQFKSDEQKKTRIAYANKRKKEACEETKKIIKKFQEMIKSFDVNDETNLTDSPLWKKYTKVIDVDEVAYLSLGYRDKASDKKIQKIIIYPDGTINVRYFDNHYDEWETKKVSLDSYDDMSSAVNLAWAEKYLDDAIIANNMYKKEYEKSLTGNLKVLNDLKSEFEHLIVAKML